MNHQKFITVPSKSYFFEHKKLAIALVAGILLFHVSSIWLTRLLAPPLSPESKPIEVTLIPSTPSTPPVVTKNPDEQPTVQQPKATQLTPPKKIESQSVIQPKSQIAITENIALPKPRQQQSTQHPTTQPRRIQTTPIQQPNTPTTAKAPTPTVTKPIKTQEALPVELPKAKAPEAEKAPQMNNTAQSEPVENTSTNQKSTTADNPKKSRENDSPKEANTPIKNDPIHLSIDAVDYINKPQPNMPETSIELEEYGTVIVSVTVDTAGKPKQVTVKKSSGYTRLDKEAMRAVKTSRFSPYKVNGEPQTIKVDVPIEFSRP